MDIENNNIVNNFLLIFLNKSGSNMLQKIILIIITLIPINIYAQYINDSLFNFYEEISPTEKFQTYGIGNYGFESRINYFNPNYFSQTTRYEINIFGIMNVNSTKKYGEYPYNTFDGGRPFIDNKVVLLPNISVGIKLGNYLISINYINDFLFDGNVTTNGSNYDIRFRTDKASYLFYVSNPTLKITNNVLQVSMARKVGNNLSLSAGLVTNSFSYDFTFNNSFTSNSVRKKYNFDMSSNLFSNLQFITSINYTNKKKISYYFLFKSPSYKNKLNPSNLTFNDSTIILNKSEINFPGHIAYGIYFKLIDRLKMSLEMLHGLVSPKLSNVDTKLNLGFNYLLLNNMHLGMIGGLYIHKAYATEMLPDGAIRYYGNSFKQAQNPFDFIFSACYDISNLNFMIGYQYTNASYKSDQGKLINESGLIYFGMSYNL